MKDFFSKYKVGIWAVVIVFSVLLIFFIIRLVFAINVVKTTVGEHISGFSTENPLRPGWNDPEIREMKKEMYWLEQQLLLAKSDSINVGINLADSIVQVQLKGTVLFQSKMLKSYPPGFLHSLDPGAYLNFGRVASISNEKASIVKKPIKRVAAPGSEAAKSGIKQDTVIDSRLQWEFYAGNHVQVVISGVEMEADSTFRVRAARDIMTYRARGFFREVFPKHYAPTLFIWLNDKDAKAIYRAHPENGKVVFRN
jgi:hypothetical protein